MTLRINTNIASLRGARALNEADEKLAKSLERLSTGFRINRGGDNPAGLVISEQMRGQIAGLNQAISNSEQATNMVQTAEGALTETNNILIRVRELALHAANQGANDPTALEADQAEIRNGLEAMSRIAAYTRFGNRTLLDGSSGINGEAQGEGLNFAAATERTRSSPITGYPINITQVPTQASLQGGTALNDRDINGLTVSLFEGGKSIQVTGTAQDSAGSFFGKLKSGVEENGLALDVEMGSDNVLHVRHKEYGSQPTFQGTSSIAGVISAEANLPQRAVSGQDIQGTIGGENAAGRGVVLTGVPGNNNTEGLSVAYTGPRGQVRNTEGIATGTFRPLPVTGTAGTVTVVNNALDFQIGPNAGQRISVAMPAVAPQFLARQVDTPSGYRSLMDINVTNPQGSRDTVRLVDAAVNEITLARGQLGAFQKHGLESNINTLRVTAENLMAAESTIRDTDAARELAEFTKQKILFESNTALLAQANQLPGNVVHLLK